MRIGKIGVLGLAAAVALVAGSGISEAKSGNCCKKGGKHSCSASQCCKRKGNDAGAVLHKRGDCTTELQIMKEGGLCGTACGKGPVTLFVPTDAAYAKLGKERLEEAKKDPKKLAQYHIVKKKVMASDIPAGGSLPTAMGEFLMTNVNDGKAQVDGCLIVEQDIPCSNGVIHIIDEVPIPERGK